MSKVSVSSLYKMIDEAAEGYNIALHIAFERQARKNGQFDLANASREKAEAISKYGMRHPSCVIFYVDNAVEKG